jgi:hypothetical protein
VVGIDEAQFFDEHIVEVCEKLAQKGIRVIVAGLDMDFRGKPFDLCLNCWLLPIILLRCMPFVCNVAISHPIHSEKFKMKIRCYSVKKMSMNHAAETVFLRKVKLNCKLR